MSDSTTPSLANSSPSFHSILKSTGIYSIAVMAGKMSSFILLPVYTRYLTPENYGVLELLDLTSFIFSTLVGVRFGEALFYFHSAASTEEERHRILSTAFLGSVILGIMGSLLGCLLSPLFSQIVFGSAGYTHYFRLVFFAFAFSLPLDVGACYLRVLNVPQRYVGAAIGRLILGIVFNVTLLTVFRMGILAVLWTSVVSSALMAIYMASLVFARIRPTFDRQLFFRLARYSLPLGIGGLGMFVIHFGDRFFLRQYVSLSEIGVYSLAYKMGMLISYLQMPFDIYWRAQMFSLVKGPGGNRIYVLVCSYLTFGLTFAVVLLGAWIHPLFSALTPGFRPAVNLVPWIAAAYVIRTIGAHFRSIFMLRRATGKEAMVTWAGSLICLAAYALLIPPFRLWGAVAATGLAFSVMFVVGLWQSQRVQHFPFEFRRMAASAAFAAALLTVLYVVTPRTFWFQVLVAAMLTVAYPALMAVFVFTSEERKSLHSLATTIIQWMRQGFRRMLASTASI